MIQIQVGSFTWQNKFKKSTENIDPNTDFIFYYRLLGSEVIIVSDNWKYAKRIVIQTFKCFAI